MMRIHDDKQCLIQNKTNHGFNITNSHEVGAKMVRGDKTKQIASIPKYPFLVTTTNIPVVSGCLTFYHFITVFRQKSSNPKTGGQAKRGNMF